MSCFHPLTVRNPKQDKNFLVDSILLTVPCGHCYVCKETKRASWFVRLYYEWKRCTSLGGFALFLTLTYREDCIPKISGERCFSKRDIQLYIKKLRQRLNRHFKNKDFNSHVKYFLTSEFGGTTHRPHYHMLIFCDIDCLRHEFSKIARETWELGFTKVGKRNFGFIDSLGGISYVAKYVAKDVYEEDYFKKLEKRLQEKGVLPEYLKSFFPFHLQSINLGLSALEFDEFNSYENFEKGFIILPDEKCKVREYKLPLYYERKIFYDTFYRYYDYNANTFVYATSISDVPEDVEYTPIYRLNDNGVCAKNKRLDRVFASVNNVYDVVFAMPFLWSYTDIKRFNDKFKTHFRNVDDIKAFINLRITKENFLEFVTLYHGVTVDGSFVGDVSTTDFITDVKNFIDVKAGYRPLDSDIASLGCNCLNMYNIKDIMLCCDMIRFLYYLIRLQEEEERKRLEMDYVHAKSVYLIDTET